MNRPPNSGYVPPKSPPVPQPDPLPPADAPQEVGGRAGPDPVRYGDWEKAGVAVDF
ncbi:DUF1674 domain-containing protein [Polymorphobacter fuscus]|uniref:DUF1674 domain-containing protein n=1 Tax=Sandarakinorhabdus fusca TaxID=1439888 RepID=A0A7C9GNV3_9SPHN|nr:DUF1674 domain-containing protein [Polymorphobacter fuscus]KAB7647720.1 DUF1674 domain-containing protein [Polymorphobacter fuscus]MQT17015.1 DUF1674 domain-containing protein [Polymorphobacter fuscus]NJC08993.1 hypothetical protein [Polymorphobacter fuscus]